MQLGVFATPVLGGHNEHVSAFRRFAQGDHLWIVHHRTRCGDFLTYSQNATTAAIPKNLSGRRFRSYSERTDKTEGNERQLHEHPVKQNLHREDKHHRYQ